MQPRELAPTLTEIDTAAEPWDEDGSFSAAVVVSGFFGLLTAGMVAATVLF